MAMAYLIVKYFAKLSENFMNFFLTWKFFYYNLSICSFFFSSNNLLIQTNHRINFFLPYALRKNVKKKCESIFEINKYLQRKNTRKTFVVLKIRLSFFFFSLQKWLLPAQLFTCFMMTILNSYFEELFNLLEVVECCFAIF